MRHEASTRVVLACVVGACLAIGACSRLTFVKPDLHRSSFTKVAPDYNVSSTAQDEKRVAAIERIGAASQQLRSGNLEEAESQAVAALDADPDSVDAYTLLAVIAQQRGQVTKSGEFYARAASLAPNNGLAQNNYGTWLCSNGRSQQSLPYFDSALKDPSYKTPAAALANSGTCALRSGQGARADLYLERAIGLDPNNPVALAALARRSYEAGKYMRARAFSQRRLAAAPASAQVLLLASQIEQKLGDTDAAARYVQQLRTRFPQAQTTGSGDATQR